MSLARQAATILGAGGIDPDAARWIAAVGSANVSAPRGRLISDTIRELKAANVWAALDFLPVLAAENAASALVDWKARKTLAPQTTVVTLPTFTTDRGYTFDGATNYLTGGFTPSTDCVAATGTSFMLGVYERTNVTNSSNAFGAINATAQAARICPRTGSNNAVAALNAASLTVVPSVTDSRGLTVAATNGVTGAGYKNGVAGDTPTLTTPGTALTSRELYVGCYNNNGSPTTFRASTLGYALFGANAWTATQHSQFYNVMQRYMTKLGANV